MKRLYSICEYLIIIIVIIVVSEVRSPGPGVYVVVPAERICSLFPKHQYQSLYTYF